MDFREKLISQNPWWAEPQTINSDERLRIYDQSKIHWEHDLPKTEGGLCVMRGPRQVGKSTLMLLRMRKLLLNEKIEPKRVALITCDLLSNAQDLHGLIGDYLALSDEFRGQTRFIFLDEVSFVPHWPLAIKQLKDLGRLKDVMVYITGSNCADIRKGAERLPGRGIEGNEYLLYPMPFSKFSELMGSSHLPKFKTPFELFGSSGVDMRAHKELENLQLHRARLEPLLSTYLERGGFLKSMNAPSGDKGGYETYLRWIEGDLSSFERDSRTGREVVKAIIEKKCSPISTLAITKETGLKNRESVAQYLSLFEDMQVLSAYYHFDPDGRQTIPRKEKKFHFLDPFIAQACASWSGTKWEESYLVEGIVAEHMRRIAASEGYQFGYYRDTSREVDVVLHDGASDRTLPIEVKWQSRISSSDFSPLYRFGRGILATKNHFEVHREKYMAIPIWLLLASMKMEPIMRLRLGIS